MSKLWRFEDVALDLEKVVMVRGTKVLLNDGKGYGSGAAGRIEGGEA